MSPQPSLFVVRALWVLLVVVVILLGLLFRKEIGNVWNPAPQSTVPFNELTKGTSGAIQERENYVLTNTLEWEDFWKTIHAASDTPELPLIDFKTSQVLAVLLGERPTGGYTISVERIIDTGDTVRLFLVEKEPGEGCIVSGAKTSPYYMIEIPRIEKPIESQTTRVLVSCES